MPQVQGRGKPFEGLRRFAAEAEQDAGHHGKSLAGNARVGHNQAAA
jgi:hypothetical protein